MIKKYKKYRWAQRILFCLAIASCVIPTLWTTISVGVTIETVDRRIALGGVAVFVCGAVALIVLKSLIMKFLSKLPFTLTVLIGVGVMFLVLIGIRKILDDAVLIVGVSLVGAFVGFGFEAASMICKAQAAEIKDLYLRKAGGEDV